jgi:homocysteine S-methyltransferase
MKPPAMPMVISGNLGPRGDGYRAETRMAPAEAQAYHAQQIETFAQTDADMVSAFTINYVDKAVGILRAARDAAMPAVISFTVGSSRRKTAHHHEIQSKSGN